MTDEAPQQRSQQARADQTPAPAQGSSNPGPHTATRGADGSTTPPRHRGAPAVLPEEAAAVGAKASGATRATPAPKTSSDDPPRRSGDAPTGSDARADDIDDIDDVTGDRTQVMMRLRDSTSVVLDPEDDVKGRTVLSGDRDELGTVDDLLIDADRPKVRMLRVKSGGLLGLGATTFFVPVEAITEIGEDFVRIDQSSQHVTGSPPYDPELVDEGAYYDAVYGYYGYTASWGAPPPTR